MKRNAYFSLWPLDPSVSYLNHGSFGAVAHDVQLVQEAFQKRMNANPNRWFRTDIPDLMVGARHITAAWFGVDPDDCAFVPNASQGVVTAVQSLVDLINRSGRTAHLVDTSLGYGGVTRGINHIAARTRSTYADAPLVYPRDLDARTIATRLREAIADKGSTTILVIDHITSETGVVLPVSDVVADLRTSHPEILVVVDGAHSAGMMRQPIPAGCDVWVGNLHKWLCAPRPAAAIVCKRPDLRSSLAPLAPSWGFEDGFPKSFEWQGTTDYSAFLTVPAAITFQEQWSWDVRDEHNRKVVDGGATLLRSMWGVDAHIDSSLEAPWMRMVKIPSSRPLTKPEVDATVERLGAELKVECMLMTVGDTSYVRLSAHMYNEVEDFERLAPIRRFLP